MSADMSALPGLILDQIGGFLEATKFIIPTVIAALVSYWLAKRSQRYSKQVDLPAMKRREMSWDIYRKVKESGEFPELVATLRQSFEHSAEIAVWEEEVVRRTRQGSMEQKILVEMPPSTIAPLRVTSYPDFKAPKSIFLFFEKLLASMMCVMGLISTILLLIISVLVVRNAISHQWSGVAVSFIVFLVGTLMLLVIQSSHQIASANILAGSGIVHARIVYEDIMANYYNRTVDIVASPLEKLQHLRASVVNESIRKHYCPSMQPEISTKSSVKKDLCLFRLGVKLWLVSICFWCGKYGPLNKMYR